MAQPAAPVVLAVIQNAYGVQSWMQLKVFGDDPNTWHTIKNWWLKTPQMDDWQPLTCTGFNYNGNKLRARFAQIVSREDAHALRGALLAVDKSVLPRLPENEYYWGELIGCRVDNRQGEYLGEVTSLLDVGVHAVLQIRHPERETETLIPFVEAYIDDVDKSTARIQVYWLSAWIEQ